MISLSKLNDGLTLLDYKGNSECKRLFLSQAQALFNGVQLCYIREGEIRVLRPNLETQANILIFYTF